MKTALLLCVAVLLVGCSDKKAFEARAEQDRRGQWTSSEEYVNDFFNFKIKFPATWVLQKGDDKKLSEKALSVFSDENNVKRTVKSALEKTYTVVQATRFPVGTPGKPNAQLMILVECIDDKPGIVLASDYLKAMEDTMKLSAINVTFTSDPHDMKLGGDLFSVRESLIPVGTLNLRQRYYVKKNGPYVILIGTTILADTDEADVKAIIDSVQQAAVAK